MLKNSVLDKEAKMQIPWLAWILVGLVISIVSALSGKSLIFFFYLGLLFIVIGFIKIIVNYITPESKKNQKAKPKQQYLGKLHDERYHQKIAQEHPHSLTKFCARCGQIARSIDNFCARCGSRWFHRRR